MRKGEAVLATIVALVSIGSFIIGVFAEKEQKITVMIGYDVNQTECIKVVK